MENAESQQKPNGEAYDTTGLVFATVKNQKSAGRLTGDLVERGRERVANVVRHSRALDEVERRRAKQHAEPEHYAESAQSVAPRELDGRLEPAEHVEPESRVETTTHVEPAHEEHDLGPLTPPDAESAAPSVEHASEHALETDGIDELPEPDEDEKEERDDLTLFLTAGMLFLVSMGVSLLLL